MARIDDIARAIMEQEGSMDLNTMQPKAGSVNYKMVTTRGLWNVGHINYAGQGGAIPVVLVVGGRQWAGWPTYDASYQGLLRQITLDANRGDTIETFIKGTPDGKGNLVGGYAPSSENPSNAYVAFLASRLGVSKDTRLSDIISGGGPQVNPTPAPVVSKSPQGRVAKISGPKSKAPSKPPAAKPAKR